MASDRSLERTPSRAEDVALGARAGDDTRLIEAQKLESVGLVAGGIAHDFNNLLTVIIGRASLALMKLGADHPARDDIDELLTAGRTAAHLTRQLLAYAGRGRFEVRLLDVSARVDELLDLLSASLPKSARIIRHLGRSLLSIEADLGQFQQVVMNLVINASESLPDGVGEINVTTGMCELDGPLPGMTSVGPVVPGRYVYVEVTDSGTGFDEATAARILEPFFSTKATGRGLGLAAVHGVLRAHRGCLQVVSRVGHGARFRALFPASREQADIPSRSSFAVQTRLGGTVLVVDDEPSILELAQLTLSQMGYTVLKASGVQEALTIFEARKSEIDIVLLDVTMPDGSGVAACERMRALRPDIPVVLSSGFDEQEASGRFAGDLYTAFLPKPYTPAQCATSFVTLLDRIQTARIEPP